MVLIVVEVGGFLVLDDIGIILRQIGINALLEFFLGIHIQNKLLSIK